MLFNKARRDFGRLQPSERASLLTLIRSLLQDSAASPQASVVQQRLTLVLAIMTAMEGEEASDALISDAMRIASTGGVRLGLDVLKALAEEGDGLERRRRNALLPVLIRRCPEVCGLVGQALSGKLTAGLGVPYEHALGCLKIWLSLDIDGGGSGLVTPGNLLSTQPELFGSLLMALHAEDETAVKMAADVISALMGQNREDDHAADNYRAIQETVKIIVSLTAKASAAADGIPETTATSVMSVTCSIAARMPDFAVGTSNEAAALAEGVLTCLRCPSRNVAEAAIEYFETLSTVPVAQRSSAFRAPLFGRMLPQLLHHARYPPDFTSWEDCVDDDRDEFHRFRDHALADILGCAYALLRMDYLQYCGSLFTNATAWHDKELALYAVRVVSGAVRVRALQSEPMKDAATQADAHQTSAFLAALFGGICSGVAPHPALANAVAHCIGDYAAWFGRAQAPLQAALQQLLGYMAIPEAAQSAALAFRNLCVRCGSQLSSQMVFAPLLQAARAALSGPGLGKDLDWQRMLVEGLARVAVLLPPAEAAAAGVEVAQPIVERIAQLMPQACGAPSSVAAAELIGRLRLLAILVRFMEANSDTLPSADAVHPAMPLLQLAYPALEAVAGSAALQADEQVYNALCEVFQRILWADKELAAPLLPGLLNAVITALESHRHAACLDTLGIAVAEYGSSAAHAPLIRDTFCRACNAVSGFLLDGAAGAAVDVRAAMYALADRYLLLSPEEFAATNTLPALGEHILPTLMATEANSVRAALSFVLHAIAPASPKGQQALRGQLEQWLSGGGQALVQALLFAACDTCPRHLLRMVAAPLRALLEDATLSEAAQHWIVHAASQPNLPGVLEGRLSKEDCENFLKIVLKRPLLPVFRFGALVTDFGSIARGERTADLLLGYEM
ncbi:g5641 [Coccomyxa elongata]